ncbi:hypothetical protein N658DRAFT_247197 [Parathielavia hyrcaniae]|uniref:Uncharacterized protein n=1 Tax=Parathielavia hyrcaniae TaxID=113614 RepID=A0AAN6T3X8_9PEZI|nr:hypothetical protein N658DRAFT_247197 [Parathielavia hyrcaniae]
MSWLDTLGREQAKTNVAATNLPHLASATVPRYKISPPCLPRGISDGASQVIISTSPTCSREVPTNRVPQECFHCLPSPLGEPYWASRCRIRQHKRLLRIRTFEPCHVKVSQYLGDSSQLPTATSRSSRFDPVYSLHPLLPANKRRQEGTDMPTPLGNPQTNAMQ